MKDEVAEVINGGLGNKKVEKTSNYMQNFKNPEEFTNKMVYPELMHDSNKLS